jgi:hypothetical protein
MTLMEMKSVSSLARAMHASLALLQLRQHLWGRQLQCSLYEPKVLSMV